jgi:hypothetical protein
MKKKLAAFTADEMNALSGVRFREFWRLEENRRTLLLRWTRECIALAEYLQTSPTFANAALFCIRAGGIFVDIAPWATNGANADEPTDDDLLQAFQGIEAAIDALRASLSDDEALWLHYTRDAEAHPWVTSYVHDYTNASTIQIGKFSRVAGRDVTFNEFNEAVERVNAAHGSLERASAALAAKMLPGLRALLSAAELFSQ